MPAATATFASKYGAIMRFQGVPATCSKWGGVPAFCTPESSARKLLKGKGWLRAACMPFGQIPLSQINFSTHGEPQKKGVQ